MIEAKFKGTSNSDRKTPENSDTFYGHPWVEWFAMRDAGIAILRDRGAVRRLITYPELWEAIETRLGKELGSSQWKVSRLLEDIDEESGLDAQFILTALVVDARTGEPSEGFLRLASKRHLLAEKDTPPIGQAGQKLTPEQRRFWEDQKAGVFKLLNAS